jgi:hypothetical protein
MTADENRCASHHVSGVRCQKDFGHTEPMHGSNEDGALTYWFDGPAGGEAAPQEIHQ